MLEQVKSKINPKNPNVVSRDIFKLVYSEAQRANKFDDQYLISVIKKLIESNNETLSYGENEKLISENEELKQVLPRSLSRSEIMAELLTIKEKVVAANEGQSIGISVKHLKSTGFDFNNNDVREVVNEIRRG